MLVLLAEAKEPAVMTGQIVVQLAKDVEPNLIRVIADKFGLKIVAENPFDKAQFVLETADEQATLAISNEINALPETAFSHPNFYLPKRRRQVPVIPNDTFFANQWHLDNDGQGGGTIDADIDADLAWSFTTGAPNIVIAVIDDGFETNHPDLQAGLWTNTGEVAGDGNDNDGNGFIDDVNGWDFTSCTATTPCGDANPNPGFGNDHGTAVAGGALARQANNLGVSGTCPNCTFMPLRAINGPVFAEGLAFNYAQTMGADIITNSWGYIIGTPATANVVTAINQAATNGRGGLGSVVLFAMNNISVNDCLATSLDISSLANVIAVSRATNQDRFSSGGFGNCMDVLGPTRGGTLDAVTADRQGANGYNDGTGGTPGTCAATEPTAPPNSDLDYTFCFGGTSFATPVTAGVAGLMLSLNNTLTRLQVQRVLQDTADKIEDSLGRYAETTGFSAPGGGAAPTHGYGRINALEAVRQVAPAGRNGVDIFVRDNRLDWGNTEQLSNVLMEPTRGFIPHWRSVDIKVDAEPFATTPPTTSTAFDAFVHENPKSGMLNRVYVRVHNRGHQAASNVTVKLHWAFAGAGLPALPSDFWTAFPADSANTTVWHPMPAQTVASIGYSGASVAGTSQDTAVIRTFDFNAPTFDPSLPNPDHYCLFAVVSAASDPVSAASMASLVPDFITPRDNNVTHRNVSLIDTGRDDRLRKRLVVSNPFPHPILTYLRANVPEGWKVVSEGIGLFERIELEAGAQKLVELDFFPNEEYARGSVDIVQVYLDPKNEKETVLGGATFRAVPKKGHSPDVIKISPEFLELLRQHQVQIDRHQKMITQLVSRREGEGVDEELLKELSALLTAQSKLLLRAGER